jgi:hypothetical protein
MKDNMNIIIGKSYNLVRFIQKYSNYIVESEKNAVKDFLQFIEENIEEIKSNVSSIKYCTDNQLLLLSMAEGKERSLKFTPQDFVLKKLHEFEEQLRYSVSPLRSVESEMREQNETKILSSNDTITQNSRFSR